MYGFIKISVWCRAANYVLLLTVLGCLVWSTECLSSFKRVSPASQPASQPAGQSSSQSTSQPVCTQSRQQKARPDGPDVPATTSYCFLPSVSSSSVIVYVRPPPPPHLLPSIPPASLPALPASRPGFKGEPLNKLK